MLDNADSEDEESLTWEYSMRREMQEIIHGLFLGPYACAVKAKLPALLSLGITHVVCVRHKAEAGIIKPNFPEEFQYLTVELSDNCCENIIGHLGRVNSFIDSALNNNGRVLVHGNAGFSRSAALVIGYVMQKFHLNFTQALDLVRNKRFCVDLNIGFVEQLKDYEMIYKAQQMLSPVTSHPKRSIEQVYSSEDMDF